MVAVEKRESCFPNHDARNEVQVLLADLKACSKTRNLGRGKHLHAEAVERAHDSNIYVATALINMYAKCGSMVHARQVFDRMRHLNVVSWNALILGYAENGQGLIALDLLTKMRSEGNVPNYITMMAALKASSSLASSGWTKCRDRCKEMQSLVMESGCNSDIRVQNTMIDMYAKCGSMTDARQVFDHLKRKDVVSWNALIVGYEANGQGFAALEMFVKMKGEHQAPNSITFMAALKACTSLTVKDGWVECKKWGRAIHNLAVETCCDSNNHVQSTLIDMYANFGSMLQARHVFDSMKHPDAVSWTALILGYVDNGEGLDAMHIFTRMRSEGPRPDSVTFSASLKACALLGALELGRTVHSEIERGKLYDIVLVTCLVDFYAKCCSLEEAQNVFDLHKTRDVITWNALLAGFSGCGDEEAVFRLFQEMQDAGFEPNSATLSSVLICCSHAGLVEKGKKCFEAMSTKYGIIPTVEHYTCMLDILGRANKLDEAMALLDTMPYSPDNVAWMTVLGACRKWKNVEIGRLAFESLIHFNNRDARDYVVMAQIYGSRGMLQEQEMVLGMRKKLTSWKTPGETCWTNELGEVHLFLV